MLLAATNLTLAWRTDLADDESSHSNICNVLQELVEERLACMMTRRSQTGTNYDEEVADACALANVNQICSNGRVGAGEDEGMFAARIRAKEGQKESHAFQPYRQGLTQLYACTSCAEADLSVPTCDFVVRFQAIRNAKIHRHGSGRARA